MRLRRREFLHLAASAAALPVMTRAAAAETYPSRPVRIVAGFPAGNASDIVARLAGQALSERSWARLSDGTPLITAEAIGSGWIVLFHITASPAWSSLPLSGL